MIAFCKTITVYQNREKFQVLAFVCYTVRMEDMTEKIEALRHKLLQLQDRL
jgi:hypothetical protein